ncbi:MAG TPA: hypothetical protein VJS66_06385, partial [Burkholderiales bacterium]|nr:hypothetical protein [Burkholderiales bacterium]
AVSPQSSVRNESVKPAHGRVRALTADDIAAVAGLYERVVHSRIPGAVLRARLSRLLLRHPWYDASLPSLVYENRDGVVGCLGVLPRPIIFDGQPVMAAVGHSFIVEPGSRSTLAALELERRFFAGPQDLSMAEGNEASRAVWEKCGGFRSPMYGLSWVRPLKPSQYALTFLSRRGLPSMAVSTLRPLCRTMDNLARSIRRGPFHFPAPVLIGSALDSAALHRAIADIVKNRVLRPHYDEQVLAWLFAALSEKEEELGTLERVLVRDANNETVGWYVYFSKPGGVGTVVQLGAKERYAEDVLQHLFHHAAIRGVVAVSGQVDPALFHAYSRKHCMFHHDGRSWMLFHSRHESLRQAIDRGQAFITRLEGEWWVGALLSRSP